MAAWLSFWNAATRHRTEEDLSGAVVSEIYVPWSKQKLKRGNAIFCVYIADDELYLITRVIASSLHDDPPDDASICIKGAHAESARADYGRVVPPRVRRVIEYLHTDGTRHSLARPNPRRFQGRASIRELSNGQEELEALL
jgi:hypothetical protein